MLALLCLRGQSAVGAQQISTFLTCPTDLGFERRRIGLRYVIGAMTMKALKFVGADLLAAASVFALCWATFATGRLLLGLGV